MAVYINFVCDANCKQCQSVNFDHETETWGDMLAVMQDAGWVLEIKDGKVVRSICPNCKALD